MPCVLSASKVTLGGHDAGSMYYTVNVSALASEIFEVDGAELTTTPSVKAETFRGWYGVDSDCDRGRDAAWDTLKMARCSEAVGLDQEALTRRSFPQRSGWASKDATNGLSEHAMGNTSVLRQQDVVWAPYQGEGATDCCKRRCGQGRLAELHEAKQLPTCYANKEGAAEMLGP
ncbi:hypothetical protein FGB62_49g14 [Gracilaria domingensis]|nr:hypothetical protein FGB62_49g14 [Gracilaria domingensis]